MIIWRWFLRTLLTCIILLMLIGSFLLTPYGFKFTFYVASKILPGELHYQAATGMITGPINIKQLDYKNKGEHLHISSLNLDWSFMALLHKRIEISHFNANGIILISPEKKESIAEKKSSWRDFFTHLKPFEPKKLTLPVTLKIDHAHITNIKLGHSEQDIYTQIKTATVNGVVYPNNIDLTLNAELLTPQPLLVTLNATGTLEHYKIHLEIKHKIYHLILNGEGNRNGVAITIPQSAALHGTMQGMIKLNWYPQINWNIDLNLAQVDLKLLDHSLPGSLDLALKTRGKLIQKNPIFDFNTTLKTAKSHLNLTAQHHQLWSIQWHIDAPSLGNLYTDASGSLQTQGTLTGEKLLLPHTKGSISGNKVYWSGLDIGKLNGKWNIFLDKKNRSTLHLTLNKIKYDERKLDIINLGITGHLLKHDLQANIDIGKHAILFTTRAHYNGDTWMGVITQFTSQHNQFGNWKLRNPTKFEYSPNNIFLNTLCLDANTGASLCMQGAWQADKPWNVSIKSNKFNFVRLEKKAMINTQFTSKLSIDASATGTGRIIKNAHFNMHITPGTLTYLMNNQVVNTAIRPSSITLLINDKVGLKSNVDLNFSVNDCLKADVSIPNFNDYTIPLEQRQLRTNIAVSMHDFRFVTLFEHVLKLSLGRLSGKFTLNGTVGDPKLKGDARLKIPHFEYTTAMIQAQDISAHIHADGSKLVYNLTGYAFNKAPIYFKGETDLTSPHAITHFEVSTKNGEIIKNNQMNVFADATIKFLITHEKLDINGDVLIPTARISPVNFSSTTTMPKANVVYIGLPDSKQPQHSHAINLNLNIKLGDHVTFKAYGMNANLAGGLNINASPQHTMIANGQVHITSGTFQAYGQYLTIAKGSSVSFTQSPVSNPFIDAKAYKLVSTTTEGVGRQLAENNILVGIHIHGTLRNMKFGLYSQPPGISQTDILSYLVLGYSSGNTNATSVSVLMDAANALIDSNGGLDQPVGLTDRIKKGLGIKELGVRNETVIDAIGNPVEDQSSFVVGDQLTKDIYVRYSRGMVVPDNIFTVQYRLNNHWILQTTTGTGGNVGTGGDILYQIETN